MTYQGAKQLIDVCGHISHGFCISYLVFSFTHQCFCQLHNYTVSLLHVVLVNNFFNTMQIDKLSEDKVNSESDGSQRRRRKRGFDVGPGEGESLFKNSASDC